MSSVLDIQYKKPKTFGGSAYISLLEQGFHLEGSAAKKNLLTCWAFVIKATEIYWPARKQKEIIFLLRPICRHFLLTSSVINCNWNYWVILSATKFTLIPESAKKPLLFFLLFTANLGLDIFFEGKEKDQLQNQHDRS